LQGGLRPCQGDQEWPMPVAPLGHACGRAGGAGQLKGASRRPQAARVHVRRSRTRLIPMRLFADLPCSELDTVIDTLIFYAMNKYFSLTT
jgi:hypothetical protein